MPYDETDRLFCNLCSKMAHTIRKALQAMNCWFSTAKRGYVCLLNILKTDLPNSDQRYNPLTGSDARVESPRYRCPWPAAIRSGIAPQRLSKFPIAPIHDVQMVRDSKVH